MKWLSTDRPSLAAANQVAMLTLVTNERAMQLGRLVAGRFSSVHALWTNLKWQWRQNRWKMVRTCRLHQINLLRYLFPHIGSPRTLVCHSDGCYWPWGWTDDDDDDNTKKQYSCVQNCLQCYATVKKHTFVTGLSTRQCFLSSSTNQSGKPSSSPYVYLDINKIQQFTTVYFNYACKAANSNFCSNQLEKYSPQK